MGVTEDRYRLGRLLFAYQWAYEGLKEMYESEYPPIQKEMCELKLIDKDGNIRKFSVQDWTDEDCERMNFQKYKETADKLSDTIIKIKSLQKRVIVLHQSLKKGIDFFYEMPIPQFVVRLDPKDLSDWGCDLIDKQEELDRLLPVFDQYMSGLNKIIQFVDTQMCMCNGIFSPRNSSSLVSSSSELGMRHPLGGSEMEGKQEASRAKRKKHRAMKPFQ